MPSPRVLDVWQPNAFGFSTPCSLDDVSVTLQQRKSAATAYSPEGRKRFAEQADRVAKKAKAIGMTLPSDKL